MFLAVSVAALLLIGGAGAGATLYQLDGTWAPKWPEGANMFSAVGVAGDGRLYVTQRGNVSIEPVLVLNKSTGELMDAWGKSHVGIAKPGMTWGAHGLALEECNFACGQGDPSNPNVRVWIEDFTHYTLTAFSSSGAKLIELGTPGVAGNSTNDPIQFGNVADAVVVTANEQDASSTVFATDGDGGFANRVMAIRIPVDSRNKPEAVWTTPHAFKNPHSITMHARSRLLVVADREHQSIKLLDSNNGNILGDFNCGITWGENASGVPFGVRALSLGGRDLLFVCAMDNPQDHRNQRIFVLDVAHLNARDNIHSRCAIIQTIAIDPAEYSGPHLLGIDQATGDVYAALVADAPLSTVLRFTAR